MDTELLLLHWRTGQTPAERLASGILGLAGYKDIDAQQPLGGPDGGKDSLIFYPFLALGIEQMYRVADTATMARCKLAGADYKETKRYVDRINWLAQQNIIQKEDLERWHALRQLRNDTSHPRDQMIMPPGIVLSLISDILELIDLLIAPPTA